MTPDDASNEAKRIGALRAELACCAEAKASDVRIVRSPYRVCPLGAHVDHQLGNVTGLALDRALLLAFLPRDDCKLVLRSRQFSNAVRVDMERIPPRPAGDWADYARGAVFALRRGYAIRRGLSVLIDGYDNVGGLSSSAAVGIAYLLALEAANGLEVTEQENIELDRIIENDYIGLDNGILDQSTILLSRKGHLMHLDCSSGESSLLPRGGSQDFLIAVLFSGLRVPLAQTGYNRRVQECQEAARRLLVEGGLAVPDSPVLRMVPRRVFDDHAHTLPVNLRRRATHFFSEQQRVVQGLEAWTTGDLTTFGRLVNESGRSSAELYECGNSYLRTAYEALRDSPGVYGARFSGAGFRGCCIGLARGGSEEGIREHALSAYCARHPDMANEADLYFCRSADGAGLLDRASGQ